MERTTGMWEKCIEFLFLRIALLETKEGENLHAKRKALWNEMMAFALRDEEPFNFIVEKPN